MVASSSDSNQAAALSRALKKAGWNPVSADSARRYEAGLRVMRGVYGMGATVCLSSKGARELATWAANMAETLEELGYEFERTEPQDDAVWFRRVKKTDKKKIREEES